MCVAADLHRRRAKGGEMDNPACADAQVVCHLLARRIQVEIGEPAIRPYPAHVAVAGEILVELRSHLLLEGQLKARRSRYLAADRRLADPGVEV